MIEGLYRAIGVLDTPGGHIFVCLILMVCGHVFSEKEWAAAGLGGLLVAMRGNSPTGAPAAAERNLVHESFMVQAVP